MSDKHEKALEKAQRELANLPPAVQEEFLNRLRRHSYSAHLDAEHTVRNSLGFGRPTCSKTDLYILSGRDETNRSGKVTVPIQLCGIATEDLPFVIVREPNFVATPHGTTPSFLTVIARSAPQPLSAGDILVDRSDNVLSERNFLIDVSVDVMAWRGDESTAGGIAFSWVCTVETARRLTIGG